MNTRKHWQKQLRRIEGAIQLYESMEKAGPLTDPDGYRITHDHLYSIRDGLRRELGIAPSAAERRERL